MSELNRENHRQRVRDSYLKNSFDSMPDSNVLEMLLFYSIPRKDVKEISYALLNRFHTLEGVFEADIKELQKVEGVGENTAILINLFHNIQTRIEKNKNREVKRISNSEAAMEFARHELKTSSKETVLVICLDNNLNVLSVNDVSYGSANCAEVDPYKILECIFKDNAANIILAHNHPKGTSKPSANDINFTIELIQLCRKINVRVNDHIIVGDDGATSMVNDVASSMFFDN